MTKRYKNSFIEEMLAFIETLKDPVFLRSEVNSLGEPRQVSRALKALVEDGKIIKVGYGVYSKAIPSKLTGRPKYPLGFAKTCFKALEKLNVQYGIANSVKAYNEGKTTQFPARLVVRLKSRFRGQIGDGRRNLIFEDGYYAR